ncbi:MAG: hypothetical protein GY807_01215 [Gammaproteobacteria bacterium]|nr:hypothetical protein [Gammaproteobacteria bacterium]
MNIYQQLIILQIIILAGCQSPQFTEDTTSPHITRAHDAAFRTYTDILIPQEQAHIYIQYGQVRNVNETNLYAPHCKLWLQNISNDIQVVRADTFKVTEVKYYTDIFLLTGITRLQVADLQFFGSGGGDLGDIMYITDLKLYSSEQRQVNRLLCQQLDDAGLGQYVSMMEIQQTLGDIANLTPNIVN